MKEGSRIKTKPDIPWSEKNPSGGFTEAEDNGSGPDLHEPHGDPDIETEIHIFAPVPFPLHCFPPVLRSMARAISESTLVPDNLSGACVLGIESASLGKGIQIQSGPDRLTRGNLYIAPSAISGSGKSEAFRHAAAPFQAMEREIIETWTRHDFPSLKTSKLVVELEVKHLQQQLERNMKANNQSIVAENKQDLASKLAELDAVEKRINTPSLIIEDTTIEALASELANNNETMSSLSADAGTIVNNVLGKYSAIKRTDDSLYVKAYSGDPHKVNRKSGLPIYLESPCMTALWLIQPDKLDTLLAEKMLTEGGLVPRFLVFHSGAEPQDITEDSTCIDSVISEAYGRLIKTLIATYRLPRSQPYTITPTQEARLALRTHHNDIAKKRRGELRDITIYPARWNEQVWRISVCLHAALHGSDAHNHQLTIETAKNAIELSDWFATQQLEILKSKRSNLRLERAQKLLSCVLNYGGAQTIRELDRRNGFKDGECCELTKEFPGLLRCEKRLTTTKGGRPGEYVVAVKKGGWDK